jgi:hypothetical protein
LKKKKKEWSNSQSKSSRSLETFGLAAMGFVGIHKFVLYKKKHTSSENKHGMASLGILRIEALIR